MPAPNGLGGQAKKEKEKIELSPKKPTNTNQNITPPNQKKQKSKNP